MKKILFMPQSFNQLITAIDYEIDTLDEIIKMFAKEPKEQEGFIEQQVSYNYKKKLLLSKPYQNTFLSFKLNLSQAILLITNISKDYQRFTNNQFFHLLFFKLDRNRNSLTDNKEVDFIDSTIRQINSLNEQELNSLRNLLLDYYRN